MVGCGLGRNQPGDPDIPPLNRTWCATRRVAWPTRDQVSCKTRDQSIGDGLVGLCGAELLGSPMGCGSICYIFAHTQIYVYICTLYIYRGAARQRPPGKEIDQSQGRSGGAGGGSNIIRRCSTVDSVRPSLAGLEVIAILGWRPSLDSWRWVRHGTLSSVLHCNTSCCPVARLAALDICFDPDRWVLDFYCLEEYGEFLWLCWLTGAIRSRSIHIPH